MNIYLLVFVFVWVWIGKAGSKLPSTNAKEATANKKLKLHTEMKQNKSEQNQIDNNAENEDDIEKKYDDETSSTEAINCVSPDIDD